MCDQYIILADNSFRECYCYFDDEAQREQVCQKWNMVISNIESKLPEFSNDYQFIDIPLCMFESVGLCKLISEEKESLSKCFPPASALLVHKAQFQESVEEVINYFDMQFCSTFEKLVEYYNNVLDPDKIVTKINEKMQKKLHPNVENLKLYLSECLEDLTKNNKEGYGFQQLCRDLAWDALVKYPRWFSINNDSKYDEIENSDQNLIKVSEAEIIKRLIAYYLTTVKENDYLAGSALFIKYANLLHSRRNSGFWVENDELLSPYKPQERLDPMLTEYACAGYYDSKMRKRKRVVVVTCDKKQKNRVKTYLHGKKRIDEVLEKLSLKNHPFVPGYIIIVDPDKHEVFDMINVGLEYSNLNTQCASMSNVK